MPQAPEIKEVMKLNPGVDAQKLAEGMDLLRQLRASGLRGGGYRLAPSVDRRRAQVIKAKGQRRIIELRKS